MRTVEIVANAVVLVGLALIATSFFWTQLAPQEWFWDEQSAAEYIDAAAELHSLPERYDEAERAGTSTARTERSDQERAIIDRFEASRARLDRAKRWRNNGGMRLRWVGLGCTIAGGVVGWYLRRQTSRS